MKTLSKVLFAGAVALLLTGCPQEGVVCSDGLTACNGLCEDLQSDTQNCGGCGIACGSGEICQAGACACAPGAEVCDGACVVLATNPQHCGTCGTACGQDEVCEAGECKVSCTGPEMSVCGQSCVALDSDVAHCGACGNACDQGQSCTNGKCGWDLVAACFTSGQVVGIQAGSWVQGKLMSLGAGPQSLAASGDVIFSVDGFDSRLYQASASKLEKLTSEATIGQFGNHALVDGAYTYVVNSGSGTLQILKNGAAHPATGIALETVGEFPFGQNTFPQVAAKVGDKVYVTLLGGFGVTEAGAGQKVVEVDVSDAAHPTKAREFDLTGLALRTSSAETKGLPRPQGIVAANGALYVSLNHSDAFYGVAGPGYVAKIALDSGEMKAIELPENKCLNAVWVAAHGEQVLVSCAGRAVYDPTSFELRAVEATGVALIEEDAVTASVSFKCAEGDATCALPMVGRFGIQGDDLVIADQNAGRIFIVGIARGTLLEKRSPFGGTALKVCPIGSAGYANVSDVLSLK